MIAATMFSGIGAPECAAPGWDWRWHAETEPFPSAVMAHRHPESINLGDVSAADFCEKAEACGRPSIIIFGSPCQDFSVVGQRVGMDGARGNLALVALGIIKRLKPRWFLFENVPGLVSSYSGSAEQARALESRIAEHGGRCLGEYTDCDEDSDWAAFLSAVRECGYLGVDRILDAQYAGVPQRRRRKFFVGYLGDWRPPFAVLFDAESLCGNPPPRREAGQRVAPTISARPTGGGGLGTDFDCDGGLTVGDESRGLDLQAVRGNQRPGELAGLPVVPAKERLIVPLQEVSHSRKNLRGTGDGIGVAGDPMFTVQSQTVHGIADLNPDIAWALQERDAKGADSSTKDGHLIVEAYRSTGNQGVYSTGDKTDTITNTRDPNHHLLAFSCKDYGNDCTENLSPPLRAMNDVDGNQNAGGQIAVAFQTRVARNGRGSAEDVVPALNGADAGATSDMRPCVATPTAVRRLTPKECERLQGFEDDYTLVPYRGKPAADGPRYKALGNAMNVAELRWILGRIDRLEREIANAKA